MEGGYLFYIDETGQHGMVADLEYLGQMNWNNAMDNVENSISQGFNDWDLPNFRRIIVNV